MYDWRKMKGIREQRGAKVAEMSGIVEKAETEKRELTAEETAKYDALRGECETLGKNIERLEQLRDLDQATRDAQARDRVIRPGIGASAGAETRDDSIGFNASEKRWCDVVPGAKAENGEPSLSLGKFLRGALTNDWTNADAERRAMGVSVGSAVPVPTILSGAVITAATNKSRVMSSGAIVVPMTSSSIKLARVQGNLGAGWKQENTGTFQSNDSAIDSVTLTAKTVGVTTKLSLEVQEDSLNIDQVITDAMSTAVAIAIDQAALFGDGLNYNPTGIANTAGISTIPNVGTLTNYDPFSIAVQRIWQTNNNPNAVILSPNVMGAAERLKTTLGDPMRKPDSVQALNWLPTNNAGIQTATVSLSGTPTGGTFKISIILQGQTLTTTAIAYNASAATVQAAVQALTGIGTLATVSGTGPWTITFNNMLGVAAVTADGSALTGGTSPAASATQTSSAFVGDWSNLLIGMRTNFLLEMSREASDANSSSWSNGQIFLRIFARMDLAPARPNAFCYLSGINC